MKPIITPLSLVAILVAWLFAPVAVQAEPGDAIDPLKGAWVAETFNSKPPPNGMKMTMTFITDALIDMEIIVGDEKEKKSVQYTATQDGKITFFYNREAEPEGSKATWEIKADKKLYITNEQNEILVFARPG